MEEPLRNLAERGAIPEGEEKAWVDDAGVVVAAHRHHMTPFLDRAVTVIPRAAYVEPATKRRQHHAVRDDIRMVVALMDDVPAVERVERRPERDQAMSWWGIAGDRWITRPDGA